jgi:hypothetical protein
MHATIWLRRANRGRRVEFRSHTRFSRFHPEHGGPLVTIENASEPQDKAGWLGWCPTPHGEREPGEVSPAHVVSAQSHAIFVAAECGSEWLSNLRPMQGTDLVIVVQQPEELPSTFALRFTRRLAAAATRGVGLTSALLVVAPDFDVRRLEARSAIARTLLRTVGGRSRGALILVAPSASSHCWPHLMALAEGLREGVLGRCDSRLCLDCDVIEAFGECETPTEWLAHLRELRLLDDG